jgi:hypothetical protein
LINTKEGVQYLLRFGGIAGVETGEGEGGQEQSQLNRFMFVSARVNDAHFPMPELEPLPAGATAPKSDAPPAPATTEQAGTDGVSAETGPVDAVSGDSAAQDGNAEEASPAEATLTPEAAESAATPTSEDDKAGPAADGSDADAADEPAATGEPAADASTEEAGGQSAGEASTDSNPDDEISRINKENQRKLDERRDNMDKARKKVAELNYRFADWYYVISEDVFRKLHLGRADIIGLSEEAKKEGPSLDAFRNLEKSGLSPEGDPAEGTED